MQRTHTRSKHAALFLTLFLFLILRAFFAALLLEICLIGTPWLFLSS